MRERIRATRSLVNVPCRTVSYRITLRDPTTKTPHLPDPRAAGRNFARVVDQLTRDPENARIYFLVTCRKVEKLSGKRTCCASSRPFGSLTFSTLVRLLMPDSLIDDLSITIIR